MLARPVGVEGAGGPGTKGLSLFVVPKFHFDPADRRVWGCCLEPVLDLDETLDSELVRAREMVVELDQPGTDGVSLLGVPVKLSRTPGAPAGPGPALGEHTRDVLSTLGYDEDEIAALEEAGAVAGPADTGARGSFMG